MKFKYFFIPVALLAILLINACSDKNSINRHNLVTRHNPAITAVDPLDALTVGNGNFAFTVDVTGLQTFPEVYENGVPLGTRSNWGWLGFPNNEGLYLNQIFIS